MSYQIIFENAIKAYEENQLDQAEILARELLSTMPKNTQVMKLLGMIAFAKDLYEQASTIFFDILKIENTEEIILKLAQSLEAWGKPNDAIEYYNKVLELSPNNSVAIYGKGICYQAIGEDNKAKIEFEKTLNIDNSNWQALLALAGLEKDKETIFALLYQAEKLSPNNPFIMYQIALANISNQEYKKALVIMEKVVDIYPHPRMNDTLALVYDLLGEESKSLAVYNNILKDSPNFIPAMIGKSEILLRNNQLNEAKELLQQVILIEKNNISALINLGAIAQKQGLLLEAIESYRKVLSINPKTPEALLNLAFILHEQDNLDEAIGLYFNILNLAPDTPNLDNALFEAIKDYKAIDKDNALKLANLWLQNNPTSNLANQAINDF